MEACWYQSCIKNQCKLGKSIFHRSCSGCSGGSIFKVQGSKLEVEIDQKSIKKWSPRWNASRHRFLKDFGWFGVPSWDGKSIKNRFLAARIDAREGQTLPGAPRSSQKLGESIFRRFSWARGGLTPPPIQRTGVAGDSLTPPKRHFSKI